MCNFKKLYCGSDGYVVRCTECNYYQVGFSSMMLTLSEYDFEDLYRNAITATNDCVCEADEDLKQIVLPTPYRGLNILLSEKELNSFIQMLDSAHSESISLMMMDMFQSKKY